MRGEQQVTAPGLSNSTLEARGVLISPFILVYEEHSRSFRSAKGQNRKERCSSRLNDLARPTADRLVSTQIRFPKGPQCGQRPAKLGLK